VRAPPLRVFEKPAKRYGDLQVLIAVRPRRYRSRIAQYLAANLDKFRGAVTGLVSDRLAIGKRHDDPIMLRSVLGGRHHASIGLRPLVNIAHIFLLRRTKNRPSGDEPEGILL
jgi:hypothetical protein